MYCKVCKTEKHLDEFSVKSNQEKYKSCDTCRLKSSRKSLSTKKLTLEEVRIYCEQNNIKCLSETYTRIRDKMRFQCNVCGYNFTTSFYSIKDEGTRCKKCRGLVKYTIDYVREFCDERQIICLDNEYVGISVPMNFKCKVCEYQFTTNFGHIKNSGTNCRKCSGSLKYTIDYVKSFCLEKKIVCLSNTYVNIFEKLNLRCAVCDFSWTATFNNIKNHSSGCPECSRSKTERLCREMFQSFLGYLFPNTRPSFLNGLELDGYSEELNLAFEYNGIQHYEYAPFFHQNGYEDFEKQKSRDREKQERCKEHGVKLVVIPSVYTYKQPDLLEDFILSKLKEMSLI